VSALRRFVCRVFGHQPEPGISPRFCIRFHCARCQQLVPGSFLTKKKANR